MTASPESGAEEHGTTPQASTPARDRDEWFLPAIEHLLDPALVGSARRGEDGAVAALVVDWVNPAAAAFMRYSPDEVVGRTLRELLGDPDLHRRAMEAVERDEPLVLAGVPSGRLGAPAGSVDVRLAAWDDRFLLVFREVSERDRLVDELRRSQEQYRTAVDNTADLIARFDREHRVVFSNPAWADVLGLTPAQWRGRRVADMGVSAEVAALADGALEQVATTGQPARLPLEVDLPEPIGRRYYVANVIPERGPDGSVTTLLVTATDLTQRRRAEIALEETAARLQRVNADLELQGAVAAHLTEGVVLVRHADRRILYANAAWEAMFGYAPGEAVGRPIEQAAGWLPDCEPAELTAEISATVAATGHWTGELRRRGPDGRERWMLLSASAFAHPEHGTVEIGTLVDVSDVRQSRQLVDQIFETSIDLLGIVEEGRLQRVNPAWSRTLGWSADELRSMSPWDLVHPGDHERARAARESLGQGEPLVAFEVRCRCRDGTYRWLQANAVPLTDRPVTVLSMRDITDHKRLEDVAARRTGHAELLAHVSAGLARARTDVEAIGRAVAETLSRDLGDRSGVLLLGEDGDTLEPVFLSDEASHRLARAAFAERPLRASDPREYAQALATGRTVIVSDLDPTARLDEVPPAWAAFMRQFPVYGNMWVPLRVRDRPLGLLMLSRDASRPPFDDDDRLLGEAIAERVALALENAQLFAAKDAAEREAREREALFRSAFDGAPVGAAMVSLAPGSQGRCLQANAALTTLTGRSRGELEGLDLETLLLGGAHDGAVLAVPADSAPGSPTWREVQLRRADGALRDVRLGISVPHTGAGYCLAHLEDVTEGKRAVEQLQARALRDDLTGLANRHLFVDRLQEALNRLSREPGSLTLIYVDVDHFKDINDSLGHEAGDQVLQEVGRRLRDAVRGIDTVARLAGDEFVILCPRTDCDAALVVVDRVLASVNRPIGLETGPVTVGASIGVAVATLSETTVDQLMHHADTAMYHAKREGRNRWRVYDDALGRRALHRHQTQQDLREGLAHGAFRLHYQPVIDLRDGRIVGTEALVRLAHPRRGLLGPAEFIDVAEDSEVIVDLGEWVLGEACRQAATWNERFGPVDVAVNVSGRQVGRPSVIEHVGTALDHSGLDPSRLCLEMTERVLIDFGPTVGRWCDDLAAANVRLALDDFGTGYSSMTYLERLPIDVVKIDKSFVAHLGRQDQGGSAIVRAISSLAHDLDLRTVAEGVESADQRAALRSLGCDQAQGYLFHRPAPDEQVTGLLATQAGR